MSSDHDLDRAADWFARLSHAAISNAALREFQAWRHREGNAQAYRERIINAAQGLDIHADHVIIADNIVNDSFMGMKSMHGSRNVVMAGNQFSKSALWGIGFMPGSGTHYAGDPEMPGIANIDCASIIAHNIVSDFGYGHSAWMWKDSSHYAIRFDAGPS